ncbi:MAG: DUF3488 domain-containing protein [Bryobacteraceae bacterium]|nr:DUF3488 domain-containing protein [Bryobacteraceae bacterium]
MRRASVYATQPPTIQVQATQVQATQAVEQVFQFSLLGLLASGYLALAGSGALDTPTIAITGAGLIVRLLIVSGFVRFEVNGYWIAAATLAYVGFYPLDVFFLSREFIPATVHLICFLAVIRVLSAKSDRDYFFVKLIAFLELLSATLLSGSVNFFLFLTLFLIFGVATFCCSEMRRASRMTNQSVVLLPGAGTGSFLRRLATLTAVMTIGIVFMTSALFFLLPRTARAAFRSMVNERYHLPGFSDEVILGQIGELKQQSTAVMHVRLQAPNEKAGLKWRGAALTQFDGQRWFNPARDLERIPLLRGPTPLATDTQRRRTGPRISYEVRIGPIDSDALFFAGTPELLQADGLRFIYRGPGETYRSGLGTTEGRSYYATGHLPDAASAALVRDAASAALVRDAASAARVPDAASAAVPAQIAPLPEYTRNTYLLIPPSTDPRIAALAQQVGQGVSARDRAEAIARHLRTSYPYTTELPPVKSADPLATFLFERRKGHCEYFASAMAVMLRSIQIPSRVVTGFQSGMYNPITGWQVVRASDAHSWVEAWIAGQGWVTFDPTPPDARGAQGTTALLSRLLLYADAAETLWRDWVMNYSIDQQIDLVSRVERKSRLVSSSTKFSEMFPAWLEAIKRLWSPIAGMVAVALVTLGLFWYFGPSLLRQILLRRDVARVSRGKAVASDAGILYGRMLRILNRRGFKKPGWLTPAEFAEALPASAQEARLVTQITSAYHDLRYAGKPDAGARMIQLLHELETTR